jgi:hypothetical protein
MPLAQEPPLHKQYAILERQSGQQHSEPWALVIHDWSALSNTAYACKCDCTSHRSKYGRDYDLGTLLLVDGGIGDSVAPLKMELRVAARIHSSRTLPFSSNDSRLSHVADPMMRLISTATEVSPPATSSNSG